MFSCEICKIFQNSFFEEHLRWLLSVSLNVMLESNFFFIEEVMFEKVLVKSIVHNSF